MPRAALPMGIELEYETFGAPGDPPLLLIMGLGAQLIAWDEGFCDLLAAAGHMVIRFDNRDAGLSTCLDGVPVDAAGVLAAAAAGRPVPAVPYLLSDLAADAVGLLDHLGIEHAHVVGASMGGMVAQLVAIEHPERVLSLVSIMSSSGERAYGQPTPEALSLLVAPPPEDREIYIEAADNTAVWSSKRYFDRDRARRRAARNYDRHFYPEGTARQLAAIYASGSRGTRLPSVTAPTLAIHGRDDALITPSGGERTAALVANGTLLLVADMGHDLPEPLWPFLTATMGAFTANAGALAALA